MRNIRNIKLTIEYDGTDYCGWQTQDNGPTVQEILEKAIEAVVGSEVTLWGSGRTDSGVHALGQTANFNTDSKIPCEKFRDAINANLPPAIVVLEAEDVEADFHARYSVKSKAYRYVIRTGPVRPALERGRCLFVRADLDVEKMREAAKRFVGKRDFAAFCAEPPENAVRNVMRLDVKEHGDQIEIEVEADGFLYNMVRRIVGTLIEVGRGKVMADEECGPTVPAQGLHLVEVRY